MFLERAISLEKATELAEMHRVEFIDELKEHGIIVYEYSDRELEKNHEVLINSMVKEAPEELLRIQMQSHAYQEWLSSDNDIYDELFKVV